MILVPTALASQGDSFGDVASGELGIFDTDTGLVIDNDPGAPLAKKIQLFMNSLNNGVILPPIIDLSRVNSITKKAYAVGANAKMTVTLPAIGNDTDAVIEAGEVIGFKVGIESGESFHFTGVNKIWKKFYLEALSTAALTATALAALINKDDESTANGGFMEATAATNVVTITFASSADDQSISLVGKTVIGIPNNVNIVIDDNVNGDVTPAFAYAQGKGAFIQALEKKFAGFMNKGTGIGDYRYIPDLPAGQYPGFTPDAVASSNYTLYTINFDINYAENTGYMNNYEVMIATANAGVVTALDLFFKALVIKGNLLGF